MPRPVTLFTGQWADVPFDIMCSKAKSFGFHGLELACWGEHLDVSRASKERSYCEQKHHTLSKQGLNAWAISNHLVGQAVCDPIDERHKAILPAHVWGDGKPENVRKRAAEEMIRTAQAARNLGIHIVNGFTGSSIWHMQYGFPPVSNALIEEGFADFARRWGPILDEFKHCGVRFAMEVHPSEIAFDIVTAQRAIDALAGRREFGFNYDPSHLAYQGVDYIEFLRIFRDRIYHVHIKDVYFRTTPGISGVFGGHLPFGDPRRYWDFRTPGRGSIDFELIIRTLNEIGYEGPLSVEWEDVGMDREQGASEACALVKHLDFRPTARAFEASLSSSPKKEPKKRKAPTKPIVEV
jgi:sugar phosphate isomerase/epimerase